jgi:hypothetical protein
VDSRARHAASKSLQLQTVTARHDMARPGGRSRAVDHPTVAMVDGTVEKNANQPICDFRK